MNHDPRALRPLPLLTWLVLVLFAFDGGGREAAAADATGRADGYRGIWFTLGQFSKHGDKYSGGLGTYTSNHNPMAVYSPAADKTFFTYGGTIKGRRHLLIMASYFDHKTGRVPRPTIVHDKQGVDDPHDNGSINLDDRGHVWIFISGRARSRPGFIYRSKEPFSVAAFERVSEEEMTYPQPWFSPGRGWLHLFTKYTRGRELYWETSRDGVTWGDDRKLAGHGRALPGQRRARRHGRELLQLPSRRQRRSADEPLLCPDGGLRDVVDHGGRPADRPSRSAT